MASLDELMTPAELAGFVTVALKFSRSPYGQQVTAIRDGREPVTVALVRSERSRRSRVMRSTLAPGSQAGPELQSQVVTDAMDGWRALKSWSYGVRPEGYKVES